MTYPEAALIDARRQLEKAAQAVKSAEEHRRLCEAEVSRWEEHFAEKAKGNPQPGDRWHEMLSAWLYVVAREGDRITVHWAGSPCTFPDDATEETVSLSEWKERHARFYCFLDSGHDVSGWLGRAKNCQPREAAP